MPIVVPLVGLDLLVVVLWAIATALAIALVMDKLSTILAGVPWVGGKLSDAVKSMARAISNAAGSLESGIDSVIGGAWHALARYMDKLFEQFVAHSSVLLHLARLVGHLAYSGSGLRALVHAATRVAHAALSLGHSLERKFHGIEHRVRVIEREIGAGIGDDVRAEVKALERTVHGIQKRVIPELRTGIQTAEGEVTQLENFIKAIPGTRYLDWAAGIVAAALGLGFLNLFRCPSFLGKTLGRGCGLWDGLEELFGLFLDAVLLADLCSVIPEAEALFAEVEAPLATLISEAAHAVCAQPPAGWGPIPTPTLYLPPAPSLTLNLP